MRRSVPVVLLMGLVLSGCSEVVPGTPSAARAVVPTPTATATATATAAPVPTGSGRPRSGLDIDPIADECLLNASEFGALVGVAVRPPEQGTVQRGDGSTGSSCVATAGSDPVAMINIYTVRSGTPADYVRAVGGAGHRVLDGAGEAAQVIDTAAGPTMQLASPGYLVTILVSGRAPTDDAWRAAATAALSRLPK